MKTKIVYILTSNGKGYYYEQCLMSAYSLRQHSPEAYVVLVVDDITNATLNGQREDLKQYVSEIKVIDLPQEYNMMQRSRHMKTNLRNYIDGDYLFVDTDTIICDCLADIDAYQENMGAVYDSHVIRNIENTGYVSDWYILSNAKKVGWESLVGCPNYNSGVLFVKDCPETHALYDLWHQYWLECHSKGLDVDMMALCRANKELGNIIKPLPDIWNCQVKRSCLDYLPSAKITHYFTANDHVCYKFAKREIQEEVKLRGLTDHVRALIANPRFAFEDGSMVIGKQDSEFINKHLHTMFLYYPRMFRLFENLADGYIQMRAIIGRRLSTK